GSFNFFSYRDPNPENTLKIVENAGRWASERDWTDKEMEEAKLSVFQSLDAPVSVSAEGMTRFLTGVDGEMEQKRREQLLDVSREDVRAAAEGLQRDVQEKGNFVLLGRKKEFVKPGEGWREEDMGMSGKPEEVEAEAAAAA
ncbi:hypothetical protein KC319_g18550, partial [Hortaea werneckii]